MGGGKGKVGAGVASWGPLVVVARWGIGIGGGGG